MYDVKPNLVIGFHGCDANVCKQLLNYPNNVKFSREPYDWLGHGMYFWENNYERAWQWAVDKKQRGKIETPAVTGAILQLGHCCDFLDSRYIKTIKAYHAEMVEYYNALGKELPKNKEAPKDANKTSCCESWIAQ